MTSTGETCLALHALAPGMADADFGSQIRFAKRHRATSGIASDPTTPDPAVDGGPHPSGPSWARLWLPAPSCEGGA